MDRRCQHCGSFYGARVGRGLCRQCWDDPAIRRFYPPLAPFGGSEAQQLRWHRCRHCGQRRAARPRGLCHACYNTRGVRQLYPSHHPSAHRGTGNGNLNAPPPETAIAAMPGSDAKIEALAERAEAGQELFHPQDGLPC